jgi:glycosyltransferase involved in cell wall biosynthesis
MVKIAMVTSYNVRCGIADYSKNLAIPLSKFVEVYIVRLPRFGMKTAEIFENIAENIPEVDLIHIQHEYGLFEFFEKNFYSIAKKKGKPIITTMHAVGFWDKDPIIATYSDKIIVHNKYCFNKLGFPDKTVIIPHGVNINNPIGKNEARKELGIPLNAKIVGFFGFISNYKGLETLIEAVSKIPDVFLLIAGGWHLEKETDYIINIKNFASNMLPNRHFFLGYVKNEDLAKVFGAMDIIVYPARYATESGALLTALSYGKAVIASDIPPFKEKEGALMTFKDTDDLVNKIEFLLNNEKEIEKLEKNAKEYVSNITWDKIAEKHLYLYKSILNIE